MVRVKGLEPPCRKALDPKSSASTSFATPASYWWVVLTEKFEYAKENILKLFSIMFWHCFFFKIPLEIAQFNKNLT